MYENENGLLANYVTYNNVIGYCQGHMVCVLGSRVFWRSPRSSYYLHGQRLPAITLFPNFIPPIFYSSIKLR